MYTSVILGRAGSIDVRRRAVVVDVVLGIRGIVLPEREERSFWIDGDTLTGGNSDPIGFIANLDERAPGWNAAAGHAVVLGAGGAARSAAFGLIGRGFDVRITESSAQYG